jgi:hypothetical protein
MNHEKTAEIAWYDRCSAFDSARFAKLDPCARRLAGLNCCLRRPVGASERAAGARGCSRVEPMDWPYAHGAQSGHAQLTSAVAALPGHTLLCCHLTGADPVAFGRRADRRSSSAQGWPWPLQLTELPRTNPARMHRVINAALETCVRSCNTFRLLQCIRLHDTIRAEHAPVAPAPAACSSAHTASSWRCSWGCSDSLPAGCPEQLLLQDGAWSPGALRRAQAAARL